MSQPDPVCGPRPPREAGPDLKSEMAGHFVHQQRAGEATAAGGAVDARREGTVIADNHDLDGNSECLFDTTERGSGPRRTDAGSSETRCTVPWPAWPPGQSSGGRRCSFSQSAGRLPARRRSRLRPAPEERRAAKWGSGHSVSLPLVEPPRGLVGLCDAQTCAADGLAKTLPETAADSMPVPTNPACAGS